MTKQEVKRELAAILSADVKGYSCLTGEDPFPRGFLESSSSGLKLTLERMENLLGVGQIVPIVARVGLKVT